MLGEEHLGLLEFPMRKHKKGELVFFTFPFLDGYDGLVHAISSRLGGISKGVYKELNLGLHVGEDRNTVIENRRRLCNSIGIDFENLVACLQVHGTEAAIVDENHRGSGAHVYATSIPGKDALITCATSVPIMILVADCVPILLFDTSRKAIAVAHGSWRGTLNGIARKTVEAMAGEFNTRPSDIIACIGPSIGPCCYEVGIDVAGLFRKSRANEAEAILVRENSKVKLDLWKANEMELLNSGLRKENIEVAGVCTSCHRDMFYSYRDENKKTGRFGGIMMLRD